MCHLQYLKDRCPDIVQSILRFRLGESRHVFGRTLPPAAPQTEKTLECTRRHRGEEAHGTSRRVLEKQ